MAKLVYDETGRLLFTKEMKEEYTILMPQMLPIHFGMFRKLLELEGYHVDQLNNDGRSVVDEGLKYVHNDTCYPALLVIGQFMDAIKHGGYDPHKVALFITQTGGGCRASNYIHLLRKALAKAGMDYIPVISVSFGLEKNPGFSLSVDLIRKLVYGMMYGDLIMWVSNQVRPYEVEAGAADAMVDRWTQQLVDRFQAGKGMSRKQMRRIFDEICADFATIPVTGEQKVRVGIVGEIYVKFSSLGNNHLEQFLLSEGVEPVVPGLTDFMIFKILPGGRCRPVRRKADQEGRLPRLYVLYPELPEGYDPGSGALRPLPRPGHLRRPTQTHPRLLGRRQQDGRRLAAHR